MLQAAILGLGWWGRTIVRTMQDSAALRVVAGIDPAPFAASACAELGIRHLPDFAAALADPAIDTIILCTPHTQHAAQIQAAAAAGKHVFCEKPLCLNLADAQASVAACNRHNVMLGVGHERRFEPAAAPAARPASRRPALLRGRAALRCRCESWLPHPPPRARTPAHAAVRHC